MKDTDKNKLIGAIMMLPLPVILLILVLRADFWIWAILLGLACASFNYGWKVLNGLSYKKIGAEVLEDVKDKMD